MIYSNPYLVSSTLINYIATSATASNLYARSFGTGEESDQAVTGDNIYPRVFLEQPFTIDKIGNELCWHVTLNITDKIRQERTDEIPALDVCLGIANALIYKFKNDKLYILDPNWNYLELPQYTDDLTEGWRVELTLKQDFPFCKDDVVLLTGGTYVTGYVRDIVGGTPYVSEWWESGSTGSMSVQLKNSSNLTSGNKSFTLGSYNSGITNYSTILGGKNNLIQYSLYSYARYGVIVNGLNNQSNSLGSLVGNGIGNVIGVYSNYSSILNGSNNLINGGYHSVIAGGFNNTVSTQKSFIGSGSQNKIAGAGSYSSILGGTFNKIYSTTSSILGGGNNTLGVGANNSTIVGGYDNGISGRTSAILGGRHNYILAPYGFITGGFNNTITVTGNYSSILGGRYNTMEGNYATIVSGRRNRVKPTATNSTILAGMYNVVETGVQFSSILAGRNITAVSSDTAYVTSMVVIDLTGNTVNSLVNVNPEGKLVRGIASIKSGEVRQQFFTGVTTQQATVLFNNLFEGISYAIEITGQDVRNWSWSNRTISGFTISSNSATPITGTTTWVAVPYQS